jgi:hypothetical protein
MTVGAFLLGFEVRFDEAGAAATIGEALADARDADVTAGADVG